MKASLQLNMGQQLTLTPQLQQAIRLLQLSTLDLNHEIQQLAEANPMLDVEEGDVDTSPLSQIQTYSTYQTSSTQTSSAQAPNYENFYHKAETLQDYLTWQMGLTPMSETDQMIATAIIDSIDDDGHLTTSLEELETALSSHETAIHTDEIEAVLHRIQRFDPVGCGTRDIAERLDVQLSQLPEDTPGFAHAKRIITKYIDYLGTRNYAKLMRKMKISQVELQVALDLIQSLHPRPGSLIDNDKTEYVIPDVIARKVNGQWRVDLNPESLPKVRINQQYATLIRRADNSDDNTYLRNNLQEARWFIKSLESRHDTLLKVARCLVEHQHEFLEHGEEAMKPLVLHDIADALDMHESTISRVTTQKYLHTPRGVFELKYFFSSHVSTKSGGECSSTAIRAIIKKLIAAENATRPLSDSKIAQLLGDQGVKVARRTVAKYRETLCIPPSNERKKITN